MMRIFQSGRQLLGDLAQASILLQDDIPDEQKLVRLADGDPPVPQVLLLSFEMCWRDDRAFTFAFVLASSLVKADSMKCSHSVLSACCSVSC